MADAVFNIVIGVQNRERIKQLETDIADAEREINRLSAAINAAGAATAQQSAQMRMYGKDIASYRSEISDLTKENINLGEAAGGATVGARLFTRAMYQMSEGAQGLMYSLPSLATQLGAGGPVAAGIGVLAVAAVELGKHWESLQDIFDSREGIDRAKSNLETLVEYLESLHSAFGEVSAGFLGMFKESAEQAAIIEKIEGFKKKRIKEGESIVEGMSEEEEDSGKAFTKASKVYGQEKLFTEAVKHITDIAEKKLGKELTPTQQTSVENDVKERIGQASRGMMSPEARAMFGSGFHEEYEYQMADIETARNKKEAKEKVDLENKIKKAHKDSVQQDINELGKEDPFGETAKSLIEGLEKVLKTADKELASKIRHAIDQSKEKGIKELDKESKIGEQAILDRLQDQKTALERQKRDLHKPEEKFHTWSGGVEMMKSLQSAILNDVPKEQLQVQKKIQEKLDRIHDAMVAVHRESKAG